MKTLGNDKKTEETILCNSKVNDNYGAETIVWAIGVTNLLLDAKIIDLNQARKLFPHIPDAGFVPEGKVNILIGNNFLSLYPSDGQGVNAVGDLSNFGSG